MIPCAGVSAVDSCLEISGSVIRETGCLRGIRTSRTSGSSLVAVQGLSRSDDSAESEGVSGTEV